MALLRTLPLPLLFAVGARAARNIQHYGAVAGINTATQASANGAALAAAFAAANSSGSIGDDRTVLVPAGLNFWLLPAVPSYDNVQKVTLELDGNISAYVTNFTEHWPGANSSAWDVLSFNDCSDITIAGNGVIDGFGYDWWWYVILTGKDHRPSLLTMSRVINVNVTGITLRNSPNYHAFLMAIQDAVIEGVTVWVNVVAQQELLGRAGLLVANYTAPRADGSGDAEATPALAALAQAEGLSDDELRRWVAWAATAGVDIPTFPLNTDGIDVSGRNIIVRNVTVTCYDDAVCIKPTMGGSEPDYNCTEDILVERALVHQGVGLTVGTVVPHVNINCIRNITFRDSVSMVPIKGIYVKSNPCDDILTCGSGVVDLVTYERITMTSPLWWGQYVGPQQQHQPGGWVPRYAAH